MLAAPPATAQPDARPAAADESAIGAWRGTIGVGAEDTVPLVLSLAKRGDETVGAINLGGANETPIRSVIVDGRRASIETEADSKLGRVSLAADLTVDGNTLSGSGSLAVGPLAVAVAIELTRQRRADVLQPVVEQRAAYFAGRWTFEYLGAEMPPLSPGSRDGTATFTSTSPHSVTGEIAGDLDGRPFSEEWRMTFDPDTSMMAVVERATGAPELLSVANWQTPLAIRFTTAPVVVRGQSYQRRRLLQVLSEVSFRVTDEISVDGGPFRRLGHATFEKAP